MIDIIDLSISIVNTNNRKLLCGCLKSIYESEIDSFNYEVILVDNASDDGSVDMVEELFPKVIILKNIKREGFSSNHNKALKISKGKFILVLNEDTILHKKALQNTIDFMVTNEQVGIMGAKSYFPNGKLQYTCGRFPEYIGEIFRLTVGIIFPVKLKYNEWKFMSDFNYENNKEVDWVCGVYFIIRRDLFNTIGYLDDKIFIYYEDTEYCLRTKNNTSYKIYYNSEVKITHYQGMSNYPNSYWSLAQNVKSGAYYFGKYLGIQYEKYFFYSCLIFYKFSIPIFHFINIITLKKSPQIKRRVFMLQDVIKHLSSN